MDRDRKRELLAHLVKTNNWQQVLVFTRTKHGANRLAQQLERDGIDADAIHGNKSQGARTRALKRFKDNELQVLVATDIAARGLDIEELPHVVNYDLPHVAEDYVHRIGRTGRAGRFRRGGVAGVRRRPAAPCRDRAADRQAHRAEDRLTGSRPARNPTHRQPAKARSATTRDRNAGGSTPPPRVAETTGIADRMAGRRTGTSPAATLTVRTGRVSERQQPAQPHHGTGGAQDDRNGNRHEPSPFRAGSTRRAAPPARPAVRAIAPRIR